MIRLPTVKGVPTWIEVKDTTGRYGEGVKLYKAIVGGKTVALPKAYIERELKFQKGYENMDYSETMKKKMSRAQSYAINKLDPEQMKQFLGKMPTIIKGMLALKKEGVVLPEGFERRLNLILKKINQLTNEEKSEFYFTYSEEFSDTTDWYHLSKKYSYARLDMFDLNEKDLERLKKLGFKDYQDYVNKIYDNLGTLNNKLNEILRARTK